MGSIGLYSPQLKEESMIILLKINLYLLNGVAARFMMTSIYLDASNAVTMATSAKTIINMKFVMFVLIGIIGNLNVR